MRIIDNWQYKYVEKCLYNYYRLQDSTLDTEVKTKHAIDIAYEFFRGEMHQTLMEEFYFKADEYRKRLTNSGHHRYVCYNLLHTEEVNGYVLRREIIYRVAMNCYALGVFKI